MEKRRLVPHIKHYFLLHTERLSCSSSLVNQASLAASLHEKNMSILQLLNDETHSMTSQMHLVKLTLIRALPLAVHAEVTSLMKLIMYSLKSTVRRGRERQ